MGLVTSWRCLLMARSTDVPVNARLGHFGSNDLAVKYGPLAILGYHERRP
jgi:hypothetical protein